MKPKVYCKDCKYLSGIFTDHCVHPYNAIKSSVTPKGPAPYTWRVNSNNDCSKQLKGRNFWDVLKGFFSLHFLEG